MYGTHFLVGEKGRKEDCRLESLLEVDGKESCTSKDSCASSVFSLHGGVPQKYSLKIAASMRFVSSQIILLKNRS